MVFPRATMATGAPEKTLSLLPSHNFEFASTGGELPEPVGKTKNLTFYQFSARSSRTNILI